MVEGGTDISGRIVWMNCIIYKAKWRYELYRRVFRVEVDKFRIFLV